MARSDGADLLPHKRLKLLELQPELREAYGHYLPEGVLLLRCHDCGHVLPLNHYSRNDQRRYGVRQICRACRRVRRRPLDCPPDPTLKEKRCRVCCHVKPIAAFARHRRQADGYTNVCRQCGRDRKAMTKSQYTYESVLDYRREQTIRTAGLLGIDCPEFDIKQCSTCRQVFVLDAFEFDTSRADWRRPQCHACHRGVAQEFDAF